MKVLVNSDDWEEVPVLNFAGQNQSSVDMRIKKSATKPISKSDGYKLPKDGVVDTSMHSFLSGGKCWIIAESGDNHDFYYEQI